MTFAQEDLDESTMMMMMPILLVDEPQSIRRAVSEENVRESVKRAHPRRHSESDAQQQPQKKRKRVRIQVEPFQVVEAQVTPIDKCWWYSKEDLVRSRYVARKLSRAVDTDQVLIETFDKACELTVVQSFDLSVQSQTQQQQHDDNKTSAVKLLKHSSAFWKQRGLERLSKNHAVSRSIQVCSVKSAVLLEQTSQYLDGVNDAERLAHASRMISRPSQNFAQMLAMADEAMAERIHAEAAKVAAKAATALGVLPQPTQAVAPTA